MNALTTFRAKRLINNELVTGLYAKCESSEDYFIFEVFAGDTRKDIKYLIKPESLGIYTGLKDKNGKMIFASLEIDGKMTQGGDIMAFPYITPIGEIGDRENEYSYNGIVVYLNSSFDVKPVKSDSGFWNNQILRNIIAVNGYVIGNQYDNDDLLTTV